MSTDYFLSKGKYATTTFHFQCNTITARESENGRKIEVFDNFIRPVLSPDIF